MEPTPATPPPVTPNPVTSSAVEGQQAMKYMKPILLVGAGLLAGFLWANYRNKKASAKKEDQLAKDITSAFNNMLDKAVTTNQTLSGFREDWTKSLEAAK